MQFIYAEYFGYFNPVRNILVTLANVKVRITALHNGITVIQVDVDNVYNHLNALVTYIVTLY